MALVSKDIRWRGPAFMRRAIERLINDIKSRLPLVPDPRWEETTEGLRLKLSTSDFPAIPPSPVPGKYRP